MKTLCWFALGSISMACSSSGSDTQNRAASKHWVGTWGASPQLTEPENNPPEPGLTGNTLRQFLYASIGGQRVRVQFSNEFGSGPITLNSVHLARSPARPAVDPSSDVELEFAGSVAVTIAEGQAVYSDPVDFSVMEQSSLAITIHFGSVPEGITGHPGSRTSSYLVEGDVAGAETLSGASRTEHWYCVSRIDVEAPESSRSVVTLGDSITDGRGSTSDGNDRWPDQLARRLRANTATRGVAVVNAGIGGNAVLAGGLGPTAEERFERDVLGQAGVRWVIILEGVNDIGNASSGSVGNSLIAAYQAFIEKAHAADVLVYGVPILPFAGSQYDNEAREQIRQYVNDWIRNGGAFDAVLDLEAAVADPENPTELAPGYDSGDKLHLSPEGYQAMAAAIDLSLFEGT